MFDNILEEGTTFRHNSKVNVTLDCCCIKHNAQYTSAKFNNLNIYTYLALKQTWAFHSLRAISGPFIIPVLTCEVN